MKHSIMLGDTVKLWYLELGWTEENCESNGMVNLIIGL